MQIRFDDHSSFHRGALGMVGASAILGLALHPFAPHSLAGPATGAGLAGGLLGIAIGTSIGYGKPRWRITAAAAACVPLLAFSHALGAPLLAAIASVMALAIAMYGLRGVRGLCALLLGSATVMLAMWSAWRIGHAQQTLRWSGWTLDATAAAAMGMIGVFALLPRHVRIAIDPVQAAMRRLPSDLDSEMRELCMRSFAIWTNAQDKLASDDPGKNLVRDGVLKTIEVATKSADVVVAGASEHDLAKRMEDLDQRIAAASDAEVKAQYQAARTALEDQRRYREHIKQNRERLVARMHNHVAALEKFQLAASGLLAARAASSGATAVKQLEELSHDVAASGEALVELELGTSAMTGAAEPKPAEA